MYGEPLVGDESSYVCYNALTSLLTFIFQGWHLLQLLNKFSDLFRDAIIGPGVSKSTDSGEVVPVLSGENPSPPIPLPYLSSLFTHVL